LKKTEKSDRSAKRVLRGPEKPGRVPAKKVEDPGRRKITIGVEAALGKTGLELVVLDIAAVSSFADWFAICHGTSDRQVRAIADEIEGKLREKGFRPISVEGATKAQWILLDYGDAVFHVFLEERRRFYGLERLWGDAPEVTREFDPGEPSSPPGP
jgi:ribosome-associated protein